MYITSIQITFLILFLKLCQSLNINDSDNDINSHSIELTQSINMARQEYLQNACDNYGYRTNAEKLTSHELDHVLVDHTHKLLYCYVPKVACTNWKRVLMILTGQWNDTDVLRIPANLAHSAGMFIRLGALDMEERLKALSDYSRFIIVRHPFERLLSAYRNKLEGNSSSALYFQSRVGRYIVKNFRKNPSADSLERGHDVTFQEFCEYIIETDNIRNMNLKKIQNETEVRIERSIETGKSNTENMDVNCVKQLNGTVDLKSSICSSSSLNQSQMDFQSTPLPAVNVFNEHWETANSLCHPCAVNYNIIGKYETLHDDSRLALSVIGAKGVSFPTSRVSSTASHLQKHLQTMPIDLLKKLYKVYEADFKLFEYGLEDLLGFEIG